MNTVRLITVSLVIVLAVACGTQSGESGGAPLASVEGPPQSIVSVLQAYETVRSRLAEDKKPEAREYEELASAAKEAMRDYEGEARAGLTDLVTAAEVAAAEARGGLSASRIQFGKVSEPLIGILSSQPELAQGRFVFECPMAKGYPKWVQNFQTVSNPYMGPAMASCGSAGRWEP